MSTPDPLLSRLEEILVEHEGWAEPCLFACLSALMADVAIEYSRFLASGPLDEFELAIRQRFGVGVEEKP